MQNGGPLNQAAWAYHSPWRSRQTHRQGVANRTHKCAERHSAHNLPIARPKKGVELAALGPPHPTQCITEQPAKCAGKESQTGCTNARRRTRGKERSLLSEAPQREPRDQAGLDTTRLHNCALTSLMEAFQQGGNITLLRPYRHVQRRTRTMRPGGARHYMARSSPRAC